MCAKPSAHPSLVLPVHATHPSPSQKLGMALPHPSPLSTLLWFELCPQKMC